MHASYAAGVKLKESGWSPAETESVIGFVDFDLRLDALHSWLVAKLLVGSAGEVPNFVADPDADSSGTSEICLGLRTYRALGRVEPFARAGITLLTAGVTSYDEGSFNAFGIDKELAFGGWVDAGLRVPITAAFTVGLVAQYSVGSDVELDGEGVQPGGTSLLITLGLRR